MAVLYVLCSYCARGEQATLSEDPGEMRVQLPPFLVRDHRATHWLHGEFSDPGSFFQLCRDVVTVDSFQRFTALES